MQGRTWMNLETSAAKKKKKNQIFTNYMISFI